MMRVVGVFRSVPRIFPVRLALATPRVPVRVLSSGAAGEKNVAPKVMSKDDKEKHADLAQRVRSVLDYTAGCGPRWQWAVDAEVEKLNAFRRQFGLKEVEAPKCSDDGTGGFATGLAIGAKLLKDKS